MKILLVDIETLPALGLFWDHPWETNIIEVIEEWRILSFSAKWLGGKQYTYIDHKDDVGLCKKLWNLLDEADIVIGHNVDRFDIRKINARFLHHKLGPPSPYATVDTLKVSHKYFGLLSHKQDDISKFTGNARKIETNKKLWLDCRNGDKKALKEMMRYNARDVLGLEQNYLTFLPWIQNHPNMGLHSEKIVCRNCGSEKVHARGEAPTLQGVYKRYQCSKCGKWLRGKLRLHTARLT